MMSTRMEICVDILPSEFFCDIQSGTTEVGKDVHAKLETCQDNVCSKVQIEYEAPMKQIRSLIENSEKCWQSFESKCFAAPLNVKNHHLGQWIDYNGKAVFLCLLYNNL